MTYSEFMYSYHASPKFLLNLTNSFPLLGEYKEKSTPLAKQPGRHTETQVTNHLFSGLKGRGQVIDSIGCMFSNVHFPRVSRKINR